MKSQIPDESWLTQDAIESLDQVWRDRVIVILQDLANLPHLRYAYVIAKSSGMRLTKMVGPDSGNDEKYNKYMMFFHLARIVEEYMVHLERPAPAHVQLELEDEMLFVGSAGELVLVAAFDGNVARGYMSMKLTKRISHLRTLFRTREKGALYV